MPQSIVLLGPAGSGKGTQAARLVDHFGLTKVEMGELIRAKAKEESPLGRAAHEIHKTGAHMPDDMVTAILRDGLSLIPAGASLLVDGYPRTLGQAHSLDAMFVERGITDMRAVYIRVSDDVALARLQQRSVCSSCKTVFATRDLKTCPSCGGAIEVRDYDQDTDAIKKRIQWFHDHVVEAVEYYRAKGVLIEVNGEQEGEAVFQDILKHLAP